jgi:hypothetical protein
MRRYDFAARNNLAKKGQIRVALDVFSHEPLPSESPFFACPGRSSHPTLEGRHGTPRRFAENLLWPTFADI